MYHRLKILLLLLLILSLYVRPTTITISSLDANKITALGTMLAIFVALSISIWGERFKRWGGYKPSIFILRSLENIQINRRGVRQGQTRLVFENRGNVPAEEVEVYVNMIYDNQIPRLNFIGVPLSWTHDGRSTRNFQPHQLRYLDLCRIDDISDVNNVPKLVLVAGSGIPTYEDLVPGRMKLDLLVSEKSGITKRYEIHLRWHMGADLVMVTRIREL